MVTLSNSLYTAFFMASHLFPFGGKPAGLLCGVKQEGGAVLPDQLETKTLEFVATVTADGEGSERLPTGLCCLGEWEQEDQATRLEGKVHLSSPRVRFAVFSFHLKANSFH